MEEKKIKILGIAPYQSLRTSMITLAESYENIELTVYVGNLDAGVTLAQQYMNDNFDIILSRGGTATMIKEISPIPVIEIPLSVTDILRTLNLSSASAEPCAVIGFPSITIPAQSLCDSLHYNLEIITINHPDEAMPALNQLKADGYQFLLCDTITENLARQAGFNPILITSGPDSIRTSFEEALEVYQFSRSLIQKCAILKDALKSHSSSTIIMKTDGNVFFSNYDAENISIVMSYLKDFISDSQKTSFTKAFHLIDNNLYSLSLHQTSYDESELYIFYIELHPIPAGSSKYGLRFSSYNDMVDMYTNSFYALTSGAKALTHQIKQLTQTNIPVMILGELGTGKNQVAAKLYIESSMKNNPYIIIDCPLINDKNWNFLTKHYNSPLFDKDNTIFISNIQVLSEHRQQQLLSLMLDTSVHKRNRVIFSCSKTLKDQKEDPSEAFINYLPCATILLPNLRELSADISSSSSLYLNALNMELSKQIIGLDAQALDLLCSYSWPGNFLQLKRVLANLALLTEGQHIQAESVRIVLEKENRQYIPQITDTFDYDRTLNDMIQDIVKVVLSKCEGNQTRAAKQLGIGRTTLWRYLNSDSE